MQKIVVLVLAGVLLAAVGCSDSKPMNAREMKQKKDVVPVLVDSVKRGDIQDLLQFNATLETENTVKIFSRLEGVIVELPLEEGTYVKKGQVLARMDGREQRLAKEKASAVVNYKGDEALKLSETTGANVNCILKDIGIAKKDPAAFGFICK